MNARHYKILSAILVVILIAILAAKLHHSPSKSAGAGSTTTATTPGSATSSTVASSTSTTTGQKTVQAQSYSVGNCVTWDQSVANAPPQVVPCKDEHIFEVDGQADMPPGKYPSAAQWAAVDSSGECYALAVVYLGGPTFYPTGKYTAASLEPTLSAWANGQNYAWCGVTLGGGTASAFLPSTKSAKNTSKGLG